MFSPITFSGFTHNVSYFRSHGFGENPESSQLTKITYGHTTEKTDLREVALGFSVLGNCRLRDTYSGAKILHGKSERGFYHVQGSKDSI